MFKEGKMIGTSREVGVGDTQGPRRVSTEVTEQIHLQNKMCFAPGAHPRAEGGGRCGTGRGRCDCRKAKGSAGWGAEKSDCQHCQGCVSSNRYLAG